MLCRVSGVRRGVISILTNHMIFSIVQSRSKTSCVGIPYGVPSKRGAFFLWKQKAFLNDFVFDNLIILAISPLIFPKYCPREEISRLQ